MSQRKRGKPQQQRSSSSPPKKSVNFFDPHVESDEEDDHMGESSSDEEHKRKKLGESGSRGDDEEDNVESVDAKRIRLAREYLKKVEEQSSSSSDESEESEEEEEDDEEEATIDKLGQRLARDRLKRAGALERMVALRAKKYVDSIHAQISKQEESIASSSPEAQAKAWQQYEVSPNVHPITYLKGHDLTVTCVALHSSGATAYSGSKDNSVLCWDVERECCKSTVLPQWKHTGKEHQCGRGEVLSLAASDDGRYLAVGGRDAMVKIFDVRLSNMGNTNKASKGENGAVATFRGHKGPVTCLAFRSQSLQLFSGSDDRCIR